MTEELLRFAGVTDGDTLRMLLLDTGPARPRRRYGVDPE